jgi:hypothetical protein
MTVSANMKPNAKSCEPEAVRLPSRKAAIRSRLVLVLEIATVVAFAAYYVDTHAGTFFPNDYYFSGAPPAHRDGNFPCVYQDMDSSAPQVGICATPMPMSITNRMPLDLVETDLRTGKFVWRQTDLMIAEGGVQIPLTRTYSAQDWLTSNPEHAFGMNANHPYDIAPVGTRNPYTELEIVLEDGDVLHFPRISKGRGYEDAFYMQATFWCARASSCASQLLRPGACLCRCCSTLRAP